MNQYMHTPGSGQVSLIFFLLVTTTELLNTARGVDKLAFAGIERVIRSVHVGVIAITLHRGSSDEFGAVGKADGHEVVVGMDIFLHCNVLISLLPGQDSKDKKAHT